MEEVVKNQLEILACKIRIGVIEGTYHAKSGHPGGSLSISDILAYLYFHEMKVDPENPSWKDRDRFVLSKGHAAPALYAALALKGFFPYEELRHLRHLGHILQGHPDMRKVPGVDMSTGSLGQGISAACGMALSAKISGDGFRVFTIVGDGESEEGQVWEAAMFAAHYKLDNLIAVFDYNNLQIDGTLAEVCSPEPLDEKLLAFGWHVIKINAHDFDEIASAFEEANQIKDKPVAIIQKSVKGKGVSFMENQVSWHGVAPIEEEYKNALSELEAKLSQLESAV